jgi:hypothetical protein
MGRQELSSRAWNAAAKNSEPFNRFEQVLVLAANRPFLAGVDD